MSDEEDDIYSEFGPPKYFYPIGFALISLAFVGTAWVRDDSAPLFASFSAGAVWLIAGLTWPLRRRTMLWVLFTAIAALHVLAIILIRFPERVSFGILFAPLVGLDVFVFWKLTVWTLKATEQR